MVLPTVRQGLFWVNVLVEAVVSSLLNLSPWTVWTLQDDVETVRIYVL